MLMWDNLWDKNLMNHMTQAIKYFLLYEVKLESNFSIEKEYVGLCGIT